MKFAWTLNPPEPSTKSPERRNWNWPSDFTQPPACTDRPKNFKLTSIEKIQSPVPRIIVRFPPASWLGTVTSPWPTRISRSASKVMTPRMLKLPWRFRKKVFFPGRVLISSVPLALILMIDRISALIDTLSFTSMPSLSTFSAPLALTSTMLAIEKVTSKLRPKLPLA